MCLYRCKFNLPVSLLRFLKLNTCLMILFLAYTVLKNAKKGNFSIKAHIVTCHQKLVWGHLCRGRTAFGQLKKEYVQLYLPVEGSCSVGFFIYLQHSTVSASFHFSGSPAVHINIFESTSLYTVQYY
jgi:hypothetical protein